MAEKQGDSFGVWLGGSMFMITVGLALFGFVGGVSLLGWQTYWYLDHGEWPTLSVITGLQWMKVQWAFVPNSWFGAYKTLERLPLSFGLVIGGLIPLVLMCFLMIAHDKMFNHNK